MPKKSKSKAKGKGKAAAGGAVVDATAGARSAKRLEQQLEIKNTQYMNLQEEYQRAQDKIHDLERRLRKETGSLKQEIQLRIDENTSTVEELQFEVATQREKIKLYESQLQAAEVVVTENETLRRRVTNLNDILSAQSAEHASTVHGLNSDRFNIRLQLEQAFRKALIEAKEKSQEDALEAMTDESKKAIQLNRKLTEELQAQAQGIRKMCEAFDLRDEELRAAKMQRRVNEAQIESTAAELTRLARVIQKQKKTMENKDEAVAKAEDAVQESKREVIKLEATIAAHKQTIAEKDTYIKTMQSRIYFLSQKLAKASTRNAAGASRLRTARQKQLLKTGSMDLPTPKFGSPVNRSATAPEGSKLLSDSFQQATSDASYDDDDSEEAGDSDPLDPAFIWNADLRRQATSPRERAPPLKTVLYPNKDPLRWDGRRSNRTANTSAHFVP